MARIRTIKPDFWTDEKIVELEPLARLLFIGLWNFADEEGRMKFSPKKIKMQILPADNADLSVLIGAIRCAGLIDVYEVEDKEYLQIINFGEHQKLDPRLKSKLPTRTNSHRFAPSEKEKEKEKEKEIKAREVDLEEVPEWIPDSEWKAFVEMRRKIKKPLTEYAKKLMFSKLEKMKKSGHDVETVLRNSIMNNWVDVYELKDQPKAKDHKKNVRTIT